MIILTRVGWHHIFPTWSKQEERTYTTPPRNTKSIPKVMFHQKNRYRFVWIVFVFFHFLFLFQQKYNNNIIFYINKYIYIYGGVSRVPTPPPQVATPSLLFESYWQHFWGPASYLLGLCSISDYQPHIHTQRQTDRQTDRQADRHRYTDT